MTARGDELRERILVAAKDVFLEEGFERASMDVIAARASTTKRTLYAHFEKKQTLFFAVIELVRSLLLVHLKTPAEYSDDAEEALVLFCGRFVETLVWRGPVRMFRLTVAEAERFPEGAARYHEAIFGTAQGWLEVFLRARLDLTREAAERAATELLGRVIYPRFFRALFGVGAIAEEPPAGAAPRGGRELAPIRRAVADVLRPYRGKF